MMEGWRKEDPPTKKNDQWELMYQNVLEELGMEKYVNEMLKSVGDCAIIAFYYLLRVG